MRGLSHTCTLALASIIRLQPEQRGAYEMLAEGGMPCGRPWKGE